MVNDAATVTFKYDHNGLRTEKYVKQNGTETTTKYIYSGTRLVHMTQGSNWLHFFYDGSGQPAEMNFNGTVYIYVKNLQGDIVGIVDTTGRIVVEYKYDAWGRPTYSNSLVDSNSTLTVRYALMLTLNPFRYRGYVYDVETSLYYLVSRYYNSIIGRFINADVLMGRRDDILSHNIFTYCDNKYIQCIDIDGFRKTYVFYYYTNTTKHPLRDEAYNSPYFDPFDPNTKMICVGDAEEFVNSWNAMEGEIDDVYLYLHGYEDGYIQFEGEGNTIGIVDGCRFTFDDLCTKEVNGIIYDFACRGAMEIGGTSVAEEFSKKGKCTVIACDVGVSYRFNEGISTITGPLWYARTKGSEILGNHWYIYSYDNSSNKVYRNLTRSRFIPAIR